MLNILAELILLILLSFFFEFQDFFFVLDLFKVFSVKLDFILLD